jgi:GT2 family glycosyltransferase
MTAVWICVNYHSDCETLQWVDALLQSSAVTDLRIVVADNTTRQDGDDFGTHLQKKSERVWWMPTPENLGYFGAARFGLARFLRDSPLPTWVMVSNVDLQFGDHGFWTALHAMRLSDDVGVVAPAIRSALTGREQNPYMPVRPSAMRMRWIQWATQTPERLARYEWGSRLKAQCAGWARAVVDQAGGRLIYAPHGACLLFRGRYFEAGGNLDHPCFLFGEEVFVAEQARTLGMTIRYVPELKIIHHEHVTTGIHRTPDMAAHVAAAAAYCAETYFGASHPRLNASTGIKPCVSG